QLGFSLQMSTKVLFFLLFLTIVMIQVEQVQGQNMVFVNACNEVCPRIPAERNECCRAHGYPKGMVPASCNVLKWAWCYV
ncbi:hypothetical protein PENTCL1PPCAC_12245, partial [Pristionchus entomophagus]